ncbi:hypothetical protein RRG08_047828 [Elysia crispata]|uniref:Sodium-coupled monocarboxylate transporter 1 n=1 Tax=Elysia crispata TaxID=231223 RepID=A0AAE1DPR4_9GAST|nr:hypothetical protein RRG08_047828 [Elysia crispata]
MEEKITDNSQHHMNIWDYVVFAVSLAVSLGIGIFYALTNKWRNNTEEYLVGGRSMGFLPTAISLIVSFQSAVTMLGAPAEACYFGIQYVWYPVGKCIASLLLVNIVVPLLYPLRVTSVYEYLELRFKSRAVRLLGSTMGIVSNIFYMGIVIYAPAVALEAVTGYPVWNSTMVTTVAAVIYTSIGGLKAVIWTDVFQSTVMLAMVLAILIKGTVEVGGPKQVWNIADAAGRMNFWNFDPDPTVRHTFWTLLVGGLSSGFNFVLANSSVQRISCTKSIKEGKRMLFFTSPTYMIAAIFVSYEGILAFSYYQTKGCDPLASRQITNPNQLVPFIVKDIFSHLPAMPGLFLAALFSASLSSLSSGLASGASMFWTDMLHPLLGDISENKSTIIIKFIVIAFGCLTCAVSFMVAEIGGTLTQITTSLLNSCAGPSSGLLLLGCFFPRCTSKGAFTGAAIAFVVGVWMSLGKSFSPNIPKAVPLQFASTDQCYSGLINSSAVINTTYASILSEANLTAPTTPVVLTTYNAMTTSAPEEKGPSGIEHLYSLSYQYLSAVSLLLTIVFGMIVSSITGMNKPGDVDPRYLVSASETLLVFLPVSARLYISSVGPQFMLEKYRNNKDDTLQSRAEYEETACCAGDDLPEVKPLYEAEKPTTDVYRA